MSNGFNVTKTKYPSFASLFYSIYFPIYKQCIIRHNNQHNVYKLFPYVEKNNNKKFT